MCYCAKIVALPATRYRTVETDCVHQRTVPSATGPGTLVLRTAVAPLFRVLFGASLADAVGRRFKHMRTRLTLIVRHLLPRALLIRGDGPK